MTAKPITRFIAAAVIVPLLLLALAAWRDAATNARWREDLLLYGSAGGADLLLLLIGWIAVRPEAERMGVRQIRAIVRSGPLAAALFFAATGQATEHGPLVLAAASLQESLTAAADAFAGRGNPRPVISFAASSALARQIDSGAPADLFVSADESWMDFLATKRLIRSGTRASFLSNRLVLIAPAGEPLALTIRRGFPLAAALGNGRLAMADPDTVPAGKYGRAALINLGVWHGIAPKVVRAENVRSALLFVERGAARAGIVYATDARASKHVQVVGAFPEISHPPITYPLALLAHSRNPAAERFRQFLLSDAGKAIFSRYGFVTR